MPVVSQDETLRLGSPLRRSPRLSSPVPQPSPSLPQALEGMVQQDNGDQSDDEDEDDDANQSRSGTPENDRWQPDGK